LALHPDGNVVVVGIFLRVNGVLHSYLARFNVATTAPVQSRFHDGRMKITGNPGGRVFIEASTNLQNWSVLQTITNVTGQVEFTDSDASSLPKRFYRVSE